MAQDYYKIAKDYYDRLRQTRAGVVQNRKSIPLWKVNEKGDEAKAEAVKKARVDAISRRVRTEKTKLEKFQIEYKRLHTNPPIPEDPSMVSHRVIGDKVEFYTNQGKQLLKVIPLEEIHGIAERTGSIVKGKVDIQPTLEILGKNLRENMLLQARKFGFMTTDPNVPPTYDSSMNREAGRGPEWGKWGTGKALGVSQMAMFAPELANMILDPSYMKRNLTRGQAVQAIDPTQGGVL